MKQTPLAMLIVGVLGLNTAQGASVITFDPDGPGPESAIQVGAFDWSPDNALAKGSSPLDNTLSFGLYSQGKLGNFLDASNVPISGTGLNTAYEITFQSVFYESGTATLNPPFVNANFGFYDDPHNANYFKIFWDDTPDADPATGQGYDDGIEILTAHITESVATFAINLDSQYQPKTADLDNYNGNQQPGYGTVIGEGGGQLKALVDAYDTQFFLTSITQTLVDLYFNTSNITPFNQVEPTGPATATVGVVGQLPNFGGAGINGYAYVNGLNGNCEFGGSLCDFLFQSDANQSFGVSNTVPEAPGWALLSLGLLAMGGLKRRRQH